MPMTIRPRRSVLYMPGSNARAMEKAKTLPADAIVLDLEDSVAPEKKAEARAAVVAAALSGEYRPRELIIRSNSLDGEWGVADVEAIARSGADALCLPKIETPQQVIDAIGCLDKSGAPGTMQIWAMIETPQGIANCGAIAGCDERLQVLVMGTTDLAKELRVPHTPDRLGLQFSLGQCVLAARLHGKDILDGVHLDLNDDEGYQAICEQGKSLGFDGKTLIHPRQVDTANRVFGPAEADVDRARRILEAWRQAGREGKGVAVVDGKLVEAMHFDEAGRLLAIAEAIEQLAVIRD